MSIILKLILNTYLFNEQFLAYLQKNCNYSVTIVIFFEEHELQNIQF